MRKRALYLVASSVLLMGMGLAAMPASGANPSITKPTPKPALKPSVKELGGAMPLPVDQRIERQNSPQDKLLVEVTKSAKSGTGYVAYVKVVWGDLDNVLKKDGKQFYSNWNGNLKLTGSATGGIDQKIQFDDGRPKAAPKPPAKPAAKPAAVTVKPKDPGEPRVGSGRDEVETAAGPKVEWESGVVGALDGLRIKITSPGAQISGTLTVGKFVIPISINGGSASPPPPSNGMPPATPGSVLQLNLKKP